MTDALNKRVDRWISAGVMDANTAARIRTFEESERSKEGLRWPVLLALGLGAVLLCAGVLLFVAAHWDELSPSWRFTLVLLLVGLFPIAGALSTDRFPALAATFYAIGTVCVGAGIFLTAQIFNLREHWPSGMLLWAIGALAGWLILRHWSQSVLLAFASTGVAGRRMASSHRRLLLQRSTDPGWPASSIPHVSDSANGRGGFRTTARTGVDWRNLAFAPRHPDVRRRARIFVVLARSSRSARDGARFWLDDRCRRSAAACVCTATKSCLGQCIVGGLGSSYWNVSLS
jgi:uncharacterized membrane protein HdeD (DUF308 family)